VAAWHVAEALQNWTRQLYKYDITLTLMTSVGSSEQLQIDAGNRAEKVALRDGTFAGLSAALAGAIIGSKLFRFNRNMTIICGALTGVLSGYQFTQAFRKSNIARLNEEQARFHKGNAQSSSIP